VDARHRLLLLLAWRLLRGDVIAAWWAAPLGLWNDLVLGSR
jgi:cell shape-determining protein MreD